MEQKREKKVVRVDSKASHAASSKASGPRATSTPAASDSAGGAPPEIDGPIWTATPEAKKQAMTLRLIALGLWALAIAGEAVAIFWVLRQSPVNMVLLIGLIVVIGALAIGGSLLWKRANRLDPASKKDTVRFFVQNQLGAIITMIAFLPLIVLVFTNKDMDAKQKGIVGTVGIVIAAVAVFFGVSTDSPSIEQYSEESNIMQRLTGEDLVYWTKSGNVFHVCEEVPDVNKESADGQIYAGSVADAHGAGKDRLTLRWESEAVKYCGYTQEEVDVVKAGDSVDVSPSPETSTPAGE